LQIKPQLDAKEAQEIADALEDLRSFLVVENEPVKARQKLLRNMMVQYYSIQ
jgi:hypothetical protein